MTAINAATSSSFALSFAPTNLGILPAFIPDAVNASRKGVNKFSPRTSPGRLKITISGSSMAITHAKRIVYEWLFAGFHDCRMNLTGNAVARVTRRHK
jgi:hypothetical protein